MRKNETQLSGAPLRTGRYEKRTRGIAGTLGRREFLSSALVCGAVLTSGRSCLCFGVGC